MLFQRSERLTLRWMPKLAGLSRLIEDELVSNNLMKESWAHDGKSDALSITVSKRVILRGVGVFVCQGETKAACTLTYSTEL